jgi:hypothetical protein
VWFGGGSGTAQACRMAGGFAGLRVVGIGNTTCYGRSRYEGLAGAFALLAAFMACLCDRTWPSDSSSVMSATE